MKYFLQNQKVLFLAKVIAFSNLVNTYIYITRANLYCGYLNMAIFDLKVYKVQCKELARVRQASLIFSVRRVGAGVGWGGLRWGGLGVGTVFNKDHYRNFSN